MLQSSAETSSTIGSVVPSQHGRPYVRRLSLVVYRLCFIPLLIWLAGCGKSPDIPVIASGSEYEDRLSEAQQISQDILVKYEQGVAISEEEKGRLKEALSIFNGLIAFNPHGFGPYFGAGKIHQILGEPELALVDYKNFVDHAPERPTEEIKQLIAEAYYASGAIYESNGEFDRAYECGKEAVKNFRKNPNYLAFLASSELRNGKDDLAAKLVAEALSIDPSHGRAKQLQLMLGKR